MKTMAVFLGLMVTGVLVVMLYLWSGESLLVLALTLITVLTALWLFQRRPWESAERSPARSDKGDKNESASKSSSAIAPPSRPEVHPEPAQPQQSKLAPEPQNDFFENSTAELNERSKWLAQADEADHLDEPDDVEAQPLETTQLTQAASHLKERVFGRKKAVFDLDAKEDDDKLWWDGHIDAEQEDKHVVGGLRSSVPKPKSPSTPKPELDESEPESLKRPEPNNPAPNRRELGGSKPSDSKVVRRRPKYARPPAGGLRVTGKKEMPLPSSSPLPGPGPRSQPVGRTDTVELQKSAGLLSALQQPPPLDATLELRDGPHTDPNRVVPSKEDIAQSEQHTDGPSENSQRSEPRVTEVRPARASYDITCSQKGLSGVPENQQAPQLWAWQQVDDMALDVHPSTGLMTLRLSFPNLRNPNEPSYAWVEFGPKQDPDLVMDEARAGWRVSKIPRSQFFRLNPAERTRQLCTFLTTVKFPESNGSDDPNEIFDQMRTKLVQIGGLTRLSPNAPLSDVMNRFRQLIDDNLVEPLTGEELIELESLGQSSTLPELYWSLDWFMEQRGKRIAFIDENQRDYLFGLIPAHLADDWDGQTVGEDSATVILDIP